MLSKRGTKADRWLQDILHQIQLAKSFVSNTNQHDFEHDVLRFYAVTRCLGIISEASRRLPDELYQPAKTLTLALIRRVQSALGLHHAAKRA